MLRILAVCCVDVSYNIYLLSVLLTLSLNIKVSAHTSDDDGCYPEKCGANEFCCDGDCCSYFASNWLAWMVLVAILFTMIITCFCFPRLPWTHNTLEPIHYQYISPEPQVIWNTKSHQQQPAIPRYHALATEEECQPYQPYRYERLAQQNPPPYDYPAPSAPPKSP